MVTVCYCKSKAEWASGDCVASYSRKERNWLAWRPLFGNKGMRKGLEKVRCPLYCDDEYAIHIPVLVIYYFEIKGTAPDQKMVKCQ
jgi:hypothetical protein